MSQAEFKTLKRSLIITMLSILVPSIGGLSAIMISDHFSIVNHSKQIEQFSNDRKEAQAKEVIYTNAIERLQSDCNYTKTELDKKADKNIMELVLKKLDKIDEKLDKQR